MSEIKKSVSLEIDLYEVSTILLEQMMEASRPKGMSCKQFCENALPKERVKILLETSKCLTVYFAANFKIDTVH